MSAETPNKVWRFWREPEFWLLLVAALAAILAYAGANRYSLSTPNCTMRMLKLLPRGSRTIMVKT